MKSRGLSGADLRGQLWAAAFLLLIIVLVVMSQAACSREEPGPPEQSWPEEEITEEQKPAPPPPPKITEEVYVEITARAALIFDKYKEDLDEAHRQMDLVYQKFGITFDDYNRYRKSLPADKRRQLEKQVQEFIQKIYQEYF
ncbi:MAG: hypothetical protein ACUVRL_05285 [Candidatus Saccharicenans sp.]|uniref:hypothetical protein n=1 Tax=Candidatus Saccharicenans sp. TaxID=2819258 RepID=UPI00404AC693